MLYTDCSIISPNPGPCCLVIRVQKCNSSQSVWDCYMQDAKACNMELPHSVRLVKFSEAMALGKERPTDLLKIKYVQQP